MNFYLLYLFLIICFPFYLSAPLNEIRRWEILNAPKEKALGSWGHWDNCQPGTYVTGVALKKQTGKDEHKDEFGVSGISLECGSVGETNRNYIQSSVAEEGTWEKERFTCEGYVEGFQLKIDTVGQGKDYAGITNLKLFCSEGKGDGNSVFEPKSESIFGQWTQKKMCRKGEYICGIQTSIKSPYERDDLVGINSLKMRCCEISYQPINCFPYDKWEMVYEIDNRHGYAPISFSYTKKIGMSRAEGKTNGGTGSADGNVKEDFQQQNKRTRNQSTSTMAPTTVATPAGEAPTPAAPTYSRDRDSNIGWFYFQTLSISKLTGFNWEKASQQTFAPEKTDIVTISVAPGHHNALYQVVGICGDILVRPEKFFQNGSYLDPNEGRRKISNYEWTTFARITKILQNFSFMYDYIFNIGKTLELV